MFEAILFIITVIFFIKFYKHCLDNTKESDEDIPHFLDE